MRLWAHLLHVRVLQQSAALPQHRQRVQRQVRLEAAEALPALGLVDRDDLGENKALPALHATGRRRAQHVDVHLVPNLEVQPDRYWILGDDADIRA